MVSMRSRWVKHENEHTCALALLGLAFHSRKSLSDSPKELLHIVPDLCTGLDKHQSVLLCLFLALCGGDFPLIVQICLVAHQHNNHVVSTLSAHIINPFSCVLERFSVRNIVHHHSNARVSDVGRNQGTESLLAGGIPKLKTDSPIFKVHSLDTIVSPDIRE